MVSNFCGSGKVVKVERYEQKEKNNAKKNGKKNTENPGLNEGLEMMDQEPVNRY